ncbi:MAG: hypothetical protein ACHQET_04255 [Chitinophagales bacterium]
MRKNFGYLLALCLLTGCAISRKVNYDGIDANLPTLNQSIGLATWDQREQVLKNARLPDFVGYTRSGAGIAYPMGTENGLPFTDNMSSSISNSLKKHGSTVSIVNTQYTEKESRILDRLKKTKSKKLILINCREFYTDGYGATSLMYNLDVKVYSDQAELLKEKNFMDKKSLGGSVAWGPGDYKKYMPAAFKRLLEEIFNDPDLTAALQH